MCSLLQRYHILRYSPLSNVRVDKVLFKGSTKVSCGLKAASNISAATVILSLCSSMSSDLISGRFGISVIKSVACQSLKEGERLILGPFRFANHDCSPNCQVRILFFFKGQQMAYIFATDNAHPQNLCIHHVRHSEHCCWGGYHGELFE